MMPRNWKSVLSIAITSLLTSAGMPRLAVAQTRVSIGVTETMETYNPYGDSVALLYDLYSEVTGPFCSYNFATGEYEGRLAQRWEIKDPNTWVFYLDKRYHIQRRLPRYLGRRGPLHEPGSRPRQQAYNPGQPNA